MNINAIEVFGVKKFDIIIGNPPYNKGGIRSPTGKQLGENNQTIWTKFVEKPFEWLKPNGFLVFINPLSWLKKSHSLHIEMLKKHMIWLKLWDDSKSKSMINADIPLSLYVLQNKINDEHHLTHVESEMKRTKITTNANVYLDYNRSTPLAYHSIFNKLIALIERHNLQIEYSTKTVKSEGEKIKLPKKYKIKDMYGVDTYTIKDGIMVKKMTEKHPDMKKRKLIIANKGSFVGAFIDDGKLGLTGTDKTYIMGYNLELILKMLTFKISSMISNFTKYRQNFLEKEVFTYLPDIRKLKINDISEEQFYRLLNLTDDELKSLNVDISTFNNNDDDDDDHDHDDDDDDDHDDDDDDDDDDDNNDDNYNDDDDDDGNNDDDYDDSYDSNDCDHSNTDSSNDSVDTPINYVSQ